jgi:hypothetical protein
LIVPATYAANSRKMEPRQPTGPVSGAGDTFEIDPLRDPRWQVFVDSHPDASVFHQPGWLKSLSLCYGYKPVALTLTPPGSPLENALLYCEVRSPLTGDRLVSVPFSDHCEPLLSAREELDSFAAHLARTIEKNGWKYFELRPVRHAPDEKRNLRLSCSYYLHRLDLRPPEQALFKGLHRDSVQRKIRRAEREALRYEEGNSEELLEHFYRLMIMTRRRHGLPPQPLNWFRSVIKSMGKNAQIRVAFKGDTAVASIFTLTTRKSLVYKYGCSDTRFNNLGGTAMLFWNAICQAKANGLVEFEMGRSDIPNKGLITFKERWAAKRSVVKYWRYPAQNSSSHTERLVKYGKRLISIAPDRALVLLGSLLYRHVG